MPSKRTANENRSLRAADREALLRFVETHPLAGLISPANVPAYIEAGLALGEALAASALKAFGGQTPEEILRSEGIALESIEAPPAEGVQLLAEYQAEPPTIRFFPARIEQVRRKLREEGRGDLAERLAEIALAHELYHHLWHSTYEEQRADDVMDLIGLTHELRHSVPPARLLRFPLTQEIASLIFVRTLLGLASLPVLGELQAGREG